MSIQVTPNKKTLSFKVKGTLDPQKLEAYYQVKPIRNHLRNYHIIEIDLGQCKGLEAGSIHWIGALYKRCCHMDKQLIIQNPSQSIRDQFKAMDIDFLLDHTDSDKKH